MTSINHPRDRCRRVPEHELLAYADDELPPARRAPIDRHLADCPACRDRLAARRRIGRMLREATPPRDDPIERALVHAALERAAARRGWRRRPVLVAAALPFVLLLAVVVGDGRLPWPDPSEVRPALQVAARDRSGAWQPLTVCGSGNAGDHRPSGGAGLRAGGNSGATFKVSLVEAGGSIVLRVRAVPSRCRPAPERTTAATAARAAYNLALGVPAYRSLGCGAVTPFGRDPTRPGTPPCR